MPSKASSRSHSNNNNQYNLVQSDDLDTRIPLMPDEAFQQGIPFNCKFIGSMDIPRPTSRVEIVAAMRRVRFEFKQKGIKKKKVTVTVSINGIKTTLRKRRSKKRRFKSSKDYMDVESSMLIESHPIYRIFYVSHDSQDVKIFSYIARETSSNVFHCCVFKANKKAQAMRIVRTVGQAFEVCHKLVGHPDDDFDVPINEEETLKKVLQELPEHKRPTAAARAHKLFSKLSRRTSDIAENSEHNPKNNNQKISHEINQKIPQELPKVEPQKLEEKTEIIQKPRPSDLNLKHEEVDLVNLSTPATPTITKTKQITPPINQSPVAKHKMQFFGSTNEIGSSGSNILSGSGSMAAIHEAQLVKEKLEQQQQQTQAALAQINLLRDQLAAESAARIEAQSRTHQLLLHNKELLDHLQSLVRHIQELEGKISNNPISLSSTNSPAPPLPQLTPRLKIERWLELMVMNESNGKEFPMGIEDEFCFNEELNKLNKVRDSKRTFVSKGESGFVSENTLNNSQHNVFKLSSSSIVRRVLRLGRREIPNKKLGRRSRRAELEKAVGIGNKSFVASTSTINKNNKNRVSSL